MSIPAHCRLVVTLCLAAGCSIVDRSHYEDVLERNADASTPRDSGSGSDATQPDDGDSAAPDTDGGPLLDGGRDAGPQVREPFLADRCPMQSKAYFLPPGASSLTLDTSDLNDDVHQGTGLKCTGEDTPGNDGFLGVEMRFGDVWHIHMAPDPNPDAGAKNPAFYVLDSTCAVRDCGFGIDVCEQGVDEHFTFAARRDGIYYLGIDDRTPGGGTYAFTATRVECGNGQSQHGKACDYTVEDDCDNECRIVLDAVNPRESARSHDDFTVANVVTFPESGAQTADVGGNIGGCEPDYYTFNAAEGDSVRITLLTDGLQPCAGEERFALELQDARAERLQAGMPSDDNSCPSLLREALVEGRYFVKLTDTLPLGAELPFGYRLRIELNPL
jgi:hypothetical protein